MPHKERHEELVYETVRQNPAQEKTLMETNDKLKKVCNIEYTRHHSIDNFASNLVTKLITYNLII